MFWVGPSSLETIQWVTLDDFLSNEKIRISDLLPEGMARAIQPTIASIALI